MKKKFHSNGKVLVTGEYFVLDGAKALAFPTQKGQSMTVHSNDTEELIWRGFDVKNKCWFKATFSVDFKLWVSSDDKTAMTLSKILKEAMALNSSFNPFGKTVETFLEFPNNWGLGSSSTLINNIAQWAAVNPFELLWNAFGGSGYDIASAMHDTPIIYTVKEKKPNVEKVFFKPDFKDDLYFIHLNQKQNSREGIRHYKSFSMDKKQTLKTLDAITEKILKTNTLSAFEELINHHETIISKTLQLNRIQTELFTDYKGVVKSLGAWGGDFVLVTFRENMYEYFESKGYKTILKFEEMIK